MSNTDQAPEPTMDEILASIRRIISDEPTENKPDAPEDNGDSVAGDIARALSFGGPDESGVSGMDDDILELTEVVDRTQPDPMMPPPAPQFGETFGDTGLEQPGSPMSDFGQSQDMGEAQPGGQLQENAFDAAFQQEAFAAEPAAGYPGAQGEPAGAAMSDQDILGAPPSGSMGENVDQDFPLLPDDAAATFGEPAISESAGEQVDAPLIDPALFADAGEAAEAVEATQNAPDFPAQDAEAPQEEPGKSDGTAFGQEDDLAADSSDIAAQLAQEIEQSVAPAEGEVSPEELAWVDDSAELETEAVAAALEQSLAAEEEGLMAEAPAEVDEPSLSTPDELPTDENVTFGALSPEDSVSPEDSIESALEKAIKAEDLEQAWTEGSGDDQKPDENVVPESEAMQEEQQPVADVEESVLATADKEVSAQGGEQEGVGTMDLSGAAGALAGMEDELSSAVASVKETVAKDEKPEERVQETAETKEPEVSEVVPAAAKSAAAAVVSPLEESIKDMLKPMLREWLDDNMPRLLEGAMKEARELENKKKDD